MTVDTILGEVEHISGWMGDADCRVLYKYASRIKGTIVEIGSYAGKSTRLLGLSSPESTIYAIEPFILNKSDEIKREFKKSVEGLDVVHIFGRSEVVGKAWGEPIDLLFVDGNHSYTQVKKDIRCFAPHLKSGCYALFHDYTTAGEGYGVKEALDKIGDKYFSSVSVEGGMACCKKI
jgi:predicted O-methyltransferase YrrM